MKHLALTLDVAPREMPTSYVSRLAARNFSADLTAFCSDVGVDLPGLSSGAKEAVNTVITLAGLPQDSFAETNVIKTSTMKYRIGDEVLNSETLCRGEIRYCPTCISEAIAGNMNAWDVIHPLHWQIIQIRSCTRHNVALQSFRDWVGRFARFDFTSFYRDVAINLDLTSQRQPADAFDHYLMKRIYGQQEINWCDALELPACWKSCEAFGVLVDFGRDAVASLLPAKARRDAMLTGFNILKGGPKSICTALDDFNRRTPARGGNQPHPSNGEVQRMLGSNRKLRPDLEPLRDIVRNYYLQNYPYPAGSKVLGLKLKERKVHSIISACRAIPVRRSVLEDMLIRRDLASRTNGFFKLKTVLHVALIDELKAEKDSYLDQSEASEYLGCSFAMFKQLQKKGILTPADGSSHWARKGYRRDQLDRLLRTISGNAPTVAKPFKGNAPLDLATRKANCTAPVIVQLILEGKFSASCLLGSGTKLSEVHVDVAQLQTTLAADSVNGFTKTQVLRRLRIGEKSFQNLVELGLLKVTRMKHSQTRITGNLVTAESLNAFLSKYVTPAMINADRPVDDRLRKADFENAEVHPVSLLRSVVLYQITDLPPEWQPGK